MDVCCILACQSQWYWVGKFVSQRVAEMRMILICYEFQDDMLQSNLPILTKSPSFHQLYFYGTMLCLLYIQ